MAWLLSMSGSFPISVRRLPDPGGKTCRKVPDTTRHQVAESERA